jgi:hypothetical protein
MFILLCVYEEASETDRGRLGSRGRVLVGVGALAVPQLYVTSVSHVHELLPRPKKGNV